MKKILLLSIIFLFSGFASHAFAQSSGNFVPLTSIPGLTQGAVADSSGLANFLNNLYKYLIGVAAVLAVIMIIWGGLEISTKDSVSQKSNGKQRITQAILGLVLVLSPVLVFSIINPSILNLSLNLKPLDIQQGTWSGDAATTQQVDTASGCTVSGVSGVLQIAVCPSPAAAEKWGQNCSGNLSAITPLTKTVSGAATSVVNCAGTASYTFIVAHNASGLFSKIINMLEPLAVSSDNPNNGTNAVLFANICKNAPPDLGWKTCISDNPSVSFSVPCLPQPKTQIPADVSGKCYKETLTCDTSSIFIGKCSNSINWTPFQ